MNKMLQIKRLKIKRKIHYKQEDYGINIWENHGLKELILN